MHDIAQRVMRKKTYAINMLHRVVKVMRNEAIRKRVQKKLYIYHSTLLQKFFRKTSYSKVIIRERALEVMPERRYLKVMRDRALIVMRRKQYLKVTRERAL